MNYSLIDKIDGADPTIRDKHWRKVLKTVTPYGLNTVDWLFHLGKFISSPMTLCVFRGKGVSNLKYILLIYFISNLLFASLSFVCPCFTIIIMYWVSSWGSREDFQPKIPYYAKMGACPMKNSGMTFTFMWNLESLCIHNLAYTIPLVGHGQGLVHSTCLTWDFLNTSHMFFHEAIRVCTAQAIN